MADRNLNIRVAFSALDKMSRPVSAARNSAAALAAQINQTRSSIKGLERQASSFDRLTAANKKTVEQLSQAKEQAREMAAAFGPLKQRTAEQVAALNQQRAAIRSLSQQQKTEQTQLNQLRAGFYAQGVAISRSSKATDQISQRTAQYNRQLAQQRQRLDAVNKAQARYGRAKEAGDKLMGGGMKTAAAGAGILAATGAGVGAYSNIEDAMKGVAKQMNGLLSDSGERTALYTDMQRAIMDASQNTPLENGAVDFAALVEGGARMGVANSDDPFSKQKADLLAFASMAAKASTAFELPAGELAESLGKIAGLYKIPTQNIEQLGDAINYLDDNAKSKGADIIDVLQRVGGLSKQIDYKQAAALGSTFLTLGTPAEVAASATNAMVRELSIATVQSNRFMDGLDALGLSADKVQKSMANDAMGTIQAVLDAANKLPKDQQVPVLTQLFGKEFGDDAQKLANNLPELRRQLELTQGAAAGGSMQRESDINKNSLSAQFQMTKAGASNAMAAAGETLREPLMDLMTTVSQVVGSIRRWIEANPQLAGTIVKVVAGLGALLAVAGSLTLAVGALLGPMALLRLSFTTLTGGQGIAGVISAVSRLGGAFQFLAGSPMQAILSAGRMVFGPLISIIAGISAPIWGLIALFAAVAIAVIKFWQPIKAFFSGLFSGLISGLQPVFDAFNAVWLPLAPIFDGISFSLSGVWDWFKNLLSPIHFSSDALEKCTSAGETFGKVVGMAISGLTWPIRMVAKGLGWILEKLGMIPDAAKAAQKVAQEMTPDAVNNLADRVNAFAGDVTAVAKESKKAEEKKKTDKDNEQEALINSLKGPSTKTNNTLSKIETNTKKDGPGEIVFKNRKPYIPIRGGYSEPLMQPKPSLLSSLIPSPWSVLQPGTGSNAPASVASGAGVATRSQVATGGDVYNININVDGGNFDEQKLSQLILDKLQSVRQQADRRKRSQLTDLA